MRKNQLVLGLAGLLALVCSAAAQQRPYIGFVYPAGGQQGKTFQVRLGGQGMDDVDQCVVSGEGVTAKVLDYRRKLGPIEMQVLRDQLRQLDEAPLLATAQSPTRTVKKIGGGGVAAPTSGQFSLREIRARLKSRVEEYIFRPEAASIANLMSVEVTIAADAKPGRRQLTIATPRGVSNPLMFEVGQLPEISRKAMATSEYEVLGKEELALRKRPETEVEQHISLPCTMNGQIASGEVNRYRFEAKKGQRFVFAADARELNPFFADAVPGWFQAVMALYDSSGKEVAYDDDYRFKPDPVILYEVPKDGEYVLVIYDAIYRGREDFVYRIRGGELPFITSVFPLGGQAGTDAATEMQGWNLDGAKLVLPKADAAPGTYSANAVGKNGLISNSVKFKLDSLPEIVEQEPNNDIAHAQKVSLPVIVNGHIDRPDDWDIFAFDGRADQTVVAEVEARRLDSPLDSFLKITDASGKVLAFNDDNPDPEAGVNTHNADSYIMYKLPADGTYYVHLGDAARHGDVDYAYRLRISEPRPDFALRITPSSLNIRSNGSGRISIEAVRKDGFQGQIDVALKDAPKEFEASAISLSGDDSGEQLAIGANMEATPQPIPLQIEGTATIGDKVFKHIAVATEDRMQAFLWRHMVPAQQFTVQVSDPRAEPAGRRVLREFTAAEDAVLMKAANSDPKARKFTKAQVKGRLHQLKLLYEEGLLTDEFYREKVLECEAAK